MNTVPPSRIASGSVADYVSSRRIGCWLFAAFQFFYLLTSTGRVRTPDEYNTLYTTESLVLRGSTAVPQAVQLNNFYGRYDVRGQPRAAYPPGQAFLCTPWYAFGRYFLTRLPGVPAADTDLIVAFASCCSSATFSALTVAFFFMLLTRIGIPASASLFAAAMVGLGTPIFAYSGWFFSEPLSSAIFVGVALLLFGGNYDAGHHQPSLPTASIAGLAIGLATMVRPSNVLAIPVFAAAILVRDAPAPDRKSALRTAFFFCAGSAVGVAPLLSYNALLFGGPFQFGYPTAAEGAKHLNTFETPLLQGLYGFLLSPGKSIFVFAPPAILALDGLRRLWRLDRGLAAIAILFPLVYLFFFARYTQWEGGYCVGPRYMVPAIVLLFVALGPLLTGVTASTTPDGLKKEDGLEPARIRKLAIVVLFLGMGVQCISLATSFMEDQAPPGRYYDASWTYRLTYSLSGQIHLLWRYLVSGAPARLGLGWDRWFVFLYKGGVSAGTLAALGLVMLAGFGISLAMLAKTWRRAAS